MASIWTVSEDEPAQNTAIGWNGLNRKKRSNKKSMIWGPDSQHEVKIGDPFKSHQGVSSLNMEARDSTLVVNKENKERSGNLT